MIEPDAAQKLVSLGFETIDSTPEEFPRPHPDRHPKMGEGD